MKLNIKLSQMSDFGRRGKEVFTNKFNNLNSKNLLRNPHQIHSSIPPSKIFSKIMKKVLKSQNKKLKPNNYLEKDLDRVSKVYLKNFLSVGAYSEACGNRLCRENVAKALYTRDNIKVDNIDNIFFGVDTAKEFENMCLSLINDDKCGVLISSLQDPLFDVITSNKKGSVINFENKFDFQETFLNIKHNINKNKKKGVISKILILSNPNTFSGNVYTYQEIKKCLEFCFNNNLLLLVDESFQNVLTGGEFNSFRKVLLEHENEEIRNNLELISLFDSSKGLFPQPSIQGCFSLFNNIDPFVVSQYVKFKNCMICTPTLGQIMTDLNFSLFHTNTLFEKNTYNEHLKEIKANQKLITENYKNLKFNLEDVADLEVYESLGGYYIWTKVRRREHFYGKYGEDFDQIISYELLNHCGIRVLPGSVVGVPGYLRFSKLVDLEQKQFDYLKEILSNL